MSRNGSGTYSVPNTFVAGTSILAADHNENWSDVGTEITNSVAADGQTTMTGPLKAASGTVSAPGITFGADTDSGLYRIGANNIGVAVNATKIIDVATTGATVVGDMNATTVKQNSFALLPVGVVFPYGGAAAPSGYLLCYGQAVSRTTYADLFTAIGTTYGTGDGSTTFNVPDLRGRVPAGQDDMGGSSANRLTGVTGSVDGDVLGGTGGAETNTLTVGQLPTGITSANAAQAINLTSNPSTTFVPTTTAALGTYNVGTGGGFQAIQAGTGSVLNPATTTNSISVTSNNTSGEAHNNVQPTIILNYIIFAGV